MNQFEQLYKTIDKLEEDFKNWETKLRNDNYKKEQDLQEWFSKSSGEKAQERYGTEMDKIAKEQREIEEMIRRRREMINKQIEEIYRKTGGFLE